jgi:asparagine synthase (glutamine-hydrolysing)
VCGFVGFVERTSAHDPGALAAMLARIRHRGPDGEGQWRRAFGDWTVSLGHRRLAILDIAGGAQPMSTTDGLACLSYNGEIYNFVELRRSLEHERILFRTRSDTEVLLHHVRRYWTKRLDALNGMFAFAVWDQEVGRLLLVRDRIGIKPLYYASLPGGGMAFASELASLLQHPRSPRGLSTSGLVSYFFSDYAHAPETLVEGVKKLEPGHYLEWQGGRITEHGAFWTMSESAPPRPQNDAELAKALWTKLGDAVERQLMADVPVGVFLSGGIDSSVVATLAQERSSKRLQTFSIAFDDRTFDESEHARRLAHRIASEHVEGRLTERNLLEVLDEALRCLDEPLADPSFIPTYLVSRLAAQRVKVVLGGDGGDELFGGYPTYQAHVCARPYALLPHSVRSKALPALLARFSVRDTYHSLEWQLKRFILRWDDDSLRRHLRWMSNMDLPQLADAMPSLRHLQAASLTAIRRFDDAANARLALDLRTYLPGSVLTKVDRASMAHGLEVRPPFLDNEMIEWAFRLPCSLKVRGLRTKYLLKLAARGHVPDSIIFRRKKGFGIPLAKWLRGPLRGKLDLLMRSSPLWESGLFDRGAFAEWRRQHDLYREDHSRPLWALLVLDEWTRRENVSIAHLPRPTHDAMHELSAQGAPPYSSHLL